MGRPIQKKFFGTTNPPSTSGEGVASIAVGGTNAGKTAVTPIVIAAPQLPGGVQAVARAHMELDTIVNFLAGTGYSVNDVLTLVEPGDAAVVRATLTVNTVDTGGEILTVSITTRGDYTALPTGTHPAGDITRYSVTGGTGTGADFNTTWRVKSVEVTTAGSGYSVAPVITTQGGTTFTATLTSVSPNSIAMTGRVVTGATVALDIIKQTGSVRYMVTDGTNTGVVSLVGAAVAAAGEATIMATDTLGSTYYVTKLTARRAHLTQAVDGGSGFEYATGAVSGWSLAAAATGVVSIANV